MERVPKIALVVFVLAAIAIAGTKSAAMVICDMDVADLAQCRQSVTGAHPPDPNQKCCSVLSTGNLTCLCSYKNRLGAFEIDPKRAMALPAKCGITSYPKCS